MKIVRDLSVKFQLILLWTWQMMINYLITSLVNFSVILLKDDSRKRLGKEWMSPPQKSHFVVKDRDKRICERLTRFPAFRRRKRL